MQAGSSLYFHIPFCTRKCPYCHFFVLPDKSDLKERFLRALLLEWESLLPKLKEYEIVSIYFGGGTPSLLGVDAIEKILARVKGSATLSPSCEITLEANPEEGKALTHFAQVGINRISLGVQALDAATLKTLGRSHTPEGAIETIFALHASGIHNISIDLMYDIPAQTHASFEKTLNTVKSLPLSHVSLYNLTFEPQTLYFKQKKQLIPLLPTPEESLSFLQCAVHHLEEMGLARYEISAFAKEGAASKHNLGYWTARPFLGFGPSAFSFWEGKRYRNVANLSRYEEALLQKKSPVDFEESLPYPENVLELLAVELRLLRGVDLSAFAPLPEKTSKTISNLIEKGWLKKEMERLRLTETGLLFYDSVASDII